MRLLRTWWPMLLFVGMLGDVFSTSYLLSTDPKNFPEGNPVVALDLMEMGKLLSIGWVNYLIIWKLLWLWLLLGVFLYMREKHYPEPLIERYGLIATICYYVLYAIGFVKLAYF